MKPSETGGTPGEPDFRPPPRFRLLRRIGAGGMGIVYEAVDGLTGEHVALKTLRHVDAASVARHRRELRLIEGLRHPNLVRMGEAFEAGESLCFSMELVRGVHLLAHLGGPAERHEARLRDTFRQLASGLQALHAAGVVHRDIKPSNVLVTEEGRVVLVDFGVAALADSSGTLTGSRIIGTADYMAPEQASGARVGPAADWYGVGVLLYEALTGELPFRGNAVAVMRDKQLYEAPAPRAAAGGIPADLAELCALLLRRDPKERPTGPDVLSRLQETEEEYTELDTENGGSEGPREPSPPLDETRLRQPAPEAPPEKGALVAGRYRLLRLLGSGGMSTVHLARDERGGQLVALKRLRAGAAGDLSMVNRFRREARILKELDSEYSVVVHDFGKAEDGALYLAMEHLEGETLAALLAREEVLPPGRAGEVALAVLDALDAAHRRGVVHRDVTLGNIFFVAGREGAPPGVKLLDFGIARLSGPDATQLTQAGGVLGTPHFMSPEQAMGRPVDARSDLYSVGIVLYRALTGAMPFGGAGAVEQLYAHVHSEPEPPARRRPDLRIPAELARVVMRAIMKDPEARYGSAREMAADLRAALDEPRDPRPKRGAAPATLLVRAWIVATLAIAAAVAAEIPSLLRGPFPGFAVESGLLVSLTHDPEWPGIQRGLMPNDMVVAVDGRPVRRARELHDHVAKLPHGAPVTYRVLRGERALDIDVPVSSLSPARLFFLYGLAWLTGVAYLLVGGVVAWKLPTSRPAQGLLAFCSALGLVLVLPIDVDLADRLPWVWYLAGAGSGAALAHLGLVFPGPRRPIRARPWLLALLYVPGALVFGARVLLPGSQAVELFCAQASSGLVVTGTAALAVLLVHAAARGKTLWTRQAARFLLGAAALAFTPTILALILPMSLGLASSTTGRLVAPFTLVLIVFPLAVAYQIRKRQLFDVQVAVYAVATDLLRSTLLAIALLVPAAAIGELAAVLGAGGAAAVAIGAAGAVALLSAPLFRGIERIAGRRRDHDPTATAAELAELTRSASTPEEVIALLVEKLQRSFQPITVRILERDGEGYRATGPKLRGRPALLSDLGVEEADEQGNPDAPLSPADVRAHLSGGGRWRAHARLILPLSGRVTAPDGAALDTVVVVGPRADGKPHSSDDAALFASLLQMASLRIDALREVQRLGQRAQMGQAPAPAAGG